MRRDHPQPDKYRNDAAYQRKLDAFFLRRENEPALDVLAELGRVHKIGGAPPYITIRVVGKDRGRRMIVVRHSDTEDDDSCGIPAGDMTKEQAGKVPEAMAKLESFAQKKLFQLQIKNAPATVMYATAIRRFLGTENPNTGDEKTDVRRRRKNKEMNARDPETTFEAVKSRAEVLICEFFRSRRLESHRTNLTGEIKRFLERRSLMAGASPDRYGQIAGALETNVAAYVSVVRQTLGWIHDTYRPPIDLTMDPFSPKSVQSDALTWADCRLVMLWAQGYVWDGRGFVRHWVLRDGELRLEYKKLDEPQLSEHRAEFLPLLRFVPGIATTGTRSTVGSLLVWDGHDHLGYIELDGVRSAVHRTGDFGPNYPNKPRATSSLTPLARSFFEVCRAKDLRDSEKHGWSLGHVIHDGRGGAVKNLAGLFNRACLALGIENSARKLKHLCVTMHWFAGFEVLDTADIVGTTLKTTVERYLYLKKRYRNYRRPVLDLDKMTFVHLADPSGDIAKIPRAPIPPRPAAPATTIAREVVHA